MRYDHVREKELINNIEVLRSRLADVQATLEHEKGNGAEVLVLRRKVENLEAENNKMLKELSAFDMDFFDEIEELKFEYAKSKAREVELQNTLNELRNR